MPVSVSETFYQPRPIQRKMNQKIIVSGCTNLISYYNSANSFAMNIYLHALTYFVSLFGLSKSIMKMSKFACSYTRITTEINFASKVNAISASKNY
jgi:hypothetical protein